MSRLVTEEVTAVINLIDLDPWRGAANITEVVGYFFVNGVVFLSNSDGE